MGLETIANQIEGVEPDVKECNRKAQVISYVDATVGKLVGSEGVSPEKVTILLNRDIENSVMNGT